MKTSKFKWISGICIMSLLACARAAVAPGGASAVVPTAAQIFEKMRDQYASLSTYRDGGQIITTVDGAVITTRFATRLAKPDFYRIEWDQISKMADYTANPGTQGAWCSGAGDYVQMGWGVQRQYNRDIALANVAGSSGGAVVALPRIFFNTALSGGPDDVIGLQRLADENVGNIKCYQVTGESASGESKTFWIGRRDFLIHQIRTEINPKVMQPALTGMGNTIEFRASRSTETYTNIVVNKRFSQADFLPSSPLLWQ